jgi:hypothetical protein
MFNFFKSKREKNLEFLRLMISAAAEGEHRAKINSAIGSLGIQLKPENNNALYCIKTSAVIVKNIMEQFGTNLSDVDEDDIFTAGVFLFTVSNHITYVIRTPFEEVASITPLELFSATHDPSEIANYVAAIGNTYNSISQSSKIIEVIGQNLITWIDAPTQEQFNKLVQLYGLCRKNIIKKD